MRDQLISVYIKLRPIFVSKCIITLYFILIIIFILMRTTHMKGVSIKYK